MADETAVLDAAPIASEPEQVSPVEDTEPVTEEPSVETPVEEPEEETPKPRSIDDLSDDELSGHERFKTLLDRKLQSERDKAIADNAKKARAQTNEWVQRGGVIQTLNAVVQKAIEEGTQVDPRVVQQSAEAMYGLLSQSNWAMFSQAVQEAMPKDASLPKEMVDKLNRAADALMTGQGNFGQLAEAHIEALVHARIEAERPKIERDAEKKFRERNQARTATDKMRAADAGRGTEPTTVSGGTPVPRNTRDILQTAPTNSPEWKAAYKSEYGIDPPSW